ncbi:hypothetical protein [Dinghuibacter silviterrae]|uniref:Uncharacterized protein n=1 Tax=Dinghuibacter silviterrae TaxID=1539049 RepID=A0A4R8DV24_9BACT|nr:hypothetical protein [Dinghuibacter silviterrae]TDX01836.1 hypothetical protein EDB95_2879 [Dinghuibacter silviterrae]
MTIHLSWSDYLVAMAALMGVYYLVVLRMLIRTNSAPAVDQGQAPPPPAREVWMDQTLQALEETVLHAQKKRYHPDEVLLALRQKMEELKAG